MQLHLTMVPQIIDVDATGKLLAKVQAIYI